MTELKNFAEELSAIHAWGIEFIESIQTIANPTLTEIVKVFTDLSTYGFFILAFTIFLWCIDYKKGLHLSYLLSFGAGCLEGLKNFLHVPRPFVYAPELMLKAESGFSTPSGHTFTSTMMYSAVLFYDKKTKMKNSARIAIAIALPFLVGFSRIYLGVHYPTDVLLGWVLGALATIIFILVTPGLDKRVSDFADKMSKISDKNIKSVKFAVAAIFSFTIILIYPQKTFLAGLLFGLASGNIYIFEAMHLNFDAKSGSILQKIIRFILGLVLIAIPVIIYKTCDINVLHPQYRLYNFLAFVAVGCIASGIAPLLFCKLNLCKQRRETNTPTESSDAKTESEI